MIYLFLLICAAYVVIVLILQKRDEQSREKRSFLEDAPRKQLWMSLAAVNLSIAGGIFALLSATDIYGYWAFAAPATAVLGLYAFYRTFVRGMSDNKNFDIRFVSHLFCSPKPSATTFPLMYLFSIIFIYIFALGWEVYVGSRILGQTMFSNPVFEDEGVIGFIIVFCVGLYAYIGGLKAVVKTDIIQLVFAIILVGMIFGKSLMDWNVAVEVSQTDPDIALDFWSIVGLILSLSIINLMAQLQTPVNWQLAKASGKYLTKNMILGVVLLISVWTTLIVATQISPLRPSYPAMIDFDGLAPRVFLMLGVTGFLFSTTDSLLIACVNLIRKFHLITKGRISEPDEMTEDETRQYKVAVPFFLAFVVFVSFAMLRLEPQIFYSLIAISGCLAAYGGLFLVVAFGYEKWLRQKRAEPWRGKSLFICFVVSALLQIGLFLNGMGDMAVWVVLGTFVAGLLVVLVPSRERR